MYLTAFKISLTLSEYSFDSRTPTKFFPRYGQPRNVAVLPDNWTTENGLLTTTMKLRRRQIAERYAAEIEELYKGHGA